MNGQLEVKNVFNKHVKETFTCSSRIRVPKLIVTNFLYTLTVYYECVFVIILCSDDDVLHSGRQSAHAETPILSTRNALDHTRSSFSIWAYSLSQLTDTRFHGAAISLQTLRVTQLVKNLFAFREIRKCISVLTRAHRRTIYPKPLETN
jgi:hypothetical protein